MAKKIIIAIIGFVCISFVTNVYADQPDNTGNGTFRITDSQGDSKDTFSLSETPYITIDLLGGSAGNIGGNDIIGFWWLTSQINNKTNIFYTGTSLSTGLTLSLEDWGDWGAQNLGLGQYSVKLTNFTSPQTLSVTPEPVSSVLFLIGGGALAFFRKKVKKS